MAVNDAVLSKAFASPDLWNATRQWWAARQAPVSWPFFLRLSEVLGAVATCGGRPPEIEPRARSVRNGAPGASRFELTCIELGAIGQA